MLFPSEKSLVWTLIFSASHEEMQYNSVFAFNQIDIPKVQTEKHFKCAIAAVTLTKLFIQLMFYFTNIREFFTSPLD